MLAGRTTSRLVLGGVGGRSVAIFIGGGGRCTPPPQARRRGDNHISVVAASGAVVVRPFSTAMVEVDEERSSSRDDSDSVEAGVGGGGVDADADKMNHRRSGRSRLEELRERLRAEDAQGGGGGVVGIRPQQQQQPPEKAVEVAQHNPSSSSPQPTSTSTSTSKLTSMDEIRTLLQTTPAPTTLQEMITDTYGRYHTYLRISLSERCNLRCRYCMPPEGVPLQAEEKLLTNEEIGRLVGLFAEAGVDKVRLTGGEPLLRPDLPNLITQIRTIPTIQSVGITTNALTLTRSLPTLLDAGMTHVNISLDTLQDEKFIDITRRKGLTLVLKAIDQAVHLFPHGRVKINCVVMKNFNDNELRDFVMLTKDRAVDVRFIEWMPFNDNGWNADRFVSYTDMLSRIQEDDNSGDAKNSAGSLNGIPPLQLQRIQDAPNDTTKWYTVPTHLGRVGFITSMSQHFCNTCNRLRITADGQIKVCLFGSKEISLRDVLRDDSMGENELRHVIYAAVQRKTFALGGYGDAEGIRDANSNRPMTLIGG